MTEEERKLAVVTWQSFVSLGASDAEARREVEKKFRVSRATSAKISRIGWRHWHMRQPKKRDHMRSVALARREEIMKRAAASKDWGTVLRAADSHSRICGVLEDDRDSKLEEYVDRIQSGLVAFSNDFFAGDAKRREQFIEGLARTFQLAVPHTRQLNGGNGR